MMKRKPFFGTVDTLPFHEALGAAQPTGSRSGFAVESQDGAEPACAAGGGERLARLQMGTVGPAHRSSEVIISSTEVGRPREQPEMTSVEGFDLVRPGQRGEVDPPLPLVAVAAVFPDVRGPRLDSVRRVLHDRSAWARHRSLLLTSIFFAVNPRPVLGA
jgi:hypothetical protein